MEGHYTIQVHATEGVMPILTKGLEKRIEELDISDNVTLIPVKISHVDYGVNPLADSDMRAYYKVKNPKGKELFQRVSIIIKISKPQDEKYVWQYTEAAMDGIRMDMGLI